MSDTPSSGKSKYQKWAVGPADLGCRARRFGLSGRRFHPRHVPRWNSRTLRKCFNNNSLQLDSGGSTCGEAGNLKVPPLRPTGSERRLQCVHCAAHNTPPQQKKAGPSAIGFLACHVRHRSPHCHELSRSTYTRHGSVQRVSHKTMSASGQNKKQHKNEHQPQRDEEPDPYALGLARGAAARQVA